MRYTKSLPQQFRLRPFARAGWPEQDYRFRRSPRRILVHRHSSYLLRRIRLRGLTLDKEAPAKKNHTRSRPNCFDAREFVRSEA